MSNDPAANSPTDDAGDEFLTEDLGDLLDDYQYKCEELDKSKTSVHRARCYLDLICIRHELELLIPRLDRRDVPSALWEIGEDILSSDPAGLHVEALGLLVEACHELFCLLTYALQQCPPGISEPELRQRVQAWLPKDSFGRGKKIG
jgi:hypothetical protein